MKKLTLTLAGLLVLGATSLVADGSKVNVKKNVNLNIVNNSKIKSSTVGMKIDAKGSKVNANENINLNLVNKSTLQNSTVGMKIDAKGSIINANKNVNLN
ncbi:MAG TPA: hypothetical protein EYM49_06315, partial [Campylobacterales bacterium]|nr:hypothetical protein [Campylobacterales bacterium]